MRNLEEMDLRAPENAWLFESDDFAPHIRAAVVKLAKGLLAQQSPAKINAMGLKHESLDLILPTDVLRTCMTFLAPDKGVAFSFPVVDSLSGCLTVSKSWNVLTHKLRFQNIEHGIVHRTFSIPQGFSESVAAFWLREKRDTLIV